MTNVPNPTEVAHHGGEGTQLPPVPPLPGPPNGPTAIVMAAAAGQAALIRIARTNLLRAISRECFAVDQPALPAPRAVRFDPRGMAVQMDFDTEAEAEAWAEKLGGLRSARHWAMVGATGYHAIVDWRGARVDLLSVVPTAQRPAAVAS